MTSENDPAPVGMDELRETLSNHPAAEIMADKHERRRMLYDLLAGHDDPMLKEMGQQLRDGQMDLHDLADTSVYREHLFERAHDRQEQFEDSIRSMREERPPKSE